MNNEENSEEKNQGEDFFDDSIFGHSLTKAIIETIREPLVVLDEKLRVLIASPAFYEAFQVKPADTEGHLLYELGNRQWDIPALHELLQGAVSGGVKMEAFEVEHEFPVIGSRTMLLTAREIKYEDGQQKGLLTIYDVTKERKLQLEREEILKQKDLLLKEMRHRIANSLQLIASILLLRAGTVDSDEARLHLNDAHERIMSIATVQRQLDATGVGEEIGVAPYLTSLCESVERSMVGERKPISVTVQADDSTISSEAAITLGLLTTELVINSIKHAFPGDREGTIMVRYESDESGLELSVSDNGIGIPGKVEDRNRSGLGTGIMGALANQLNAKIITDTSSEGTTVTITQRGAAPQAFKKVL